MELGSIKLTGKRALLVEDNELNAEIATEILSMKGILVERAVDRMEAVDLVDGLLGRLLRYYLYGYPDAAKTVGMNEHIAKPLDLNVLSRTLNHWLR